MLPFQSEAVHAFIPSAYSSSGTCSEGIGMLFMAFLLSAIGIYTGLDGDHLINPVEESAL